MSGTTNSDILLHRGQIERPVSFSCRCPPHGLDLRDLDYCQDLLIKRDRVGLVLIPFVIIQLERRGMQYTVAEAGKRQWNRDQHR